MDTTTPKLAAPGDAYAGPTLYARDLAAALARVAYLEDALAGAHLAANLAPTGSTLADGACEFCGQFTTLLCVRCGRELCHIHAAWTRPMEAHAMGSLPCPENPGPSAPQPPTGPAGPSPRGVRPGAAGRRSEQAALGPAPGGSTPTVMPDPPAKLLDAAPNPFEAFRLGMAWRLGWLASDGRAR